MIKSFLQITFFLLISLTGLGQQIHSISGTVSLDREESIYGNAIALNPEDSTILTGSPIIDGKYRLDGLDVKQLILKLSSLSFEDHLVLIEYNGKTDVQLDNIQLRALTETLGEITVKARKPIVIEKADGSIEIKISDTNLANSTSTLELIGKSPGIVLDNSGNINVFGKGQAIIFLNGMRVSNDILNTLAPAQIESISLLTNPGARYDAEGQAVVEIITKAGLRSEGEKALIKNTFTYAPFGGPQNRSDLNYQLAKDKWVMTGNYAFLKGEHRHILETTRERNNNEDYFLSDLYTDRQFDLEHESSYSLGAQYSFKADQYISIQYNGAYELLGGEQYSKNKIKYQQEGIYESNVALDEINRRNNLSGNFFHKNREANSTLFVGMQYAAFEHGFDNFIEQISTIEGNQELEEIINQGQKQTVTWSSQIDYEKSLYKSIGLSIGLKYQMANIQSFTDFFNVLPDQGSEKIESISNSFNYVEHVPAAYFSIAGDLSEGIHYKLGIRSEYTDYTLASSLAEGGPVKDSYLNLFPNLSINLSLKEHASAFLNYSSRISRAPYDRLNPFVVYQDAFTSIQGNPELKPSVAHTMELGGNKYGWGVKTAYTYVIDPQDGGAFQSKDDPRVYILQRTNLSRQHLYNLSLTKNIDLKWWNSSNTLSVSHSQLIDDLDRYGAVGIQPYVYLHSQNSFPLKNNFTLFLTAWYLGDKRDGASHEKDLSQVNLSLQKKFWQQKAFVALEVNDIFHQLRYDGIYRLGETDIVYFNTMNSQNIRLSFSLQFGKLKQLDFYNKDVGESATSRAR